MTRGSRQTSAVLLFPLAGGEPRELLRVSYPEAFYPFGTTWTPDSRAVTVIKRSGDKAELWLVPVTDGQPRKLDIDVNDWPGYRPGFRLHADGLHPDGRQIAFIGGKSIPEVWALENFLPTLTASK